MERTPIKIPGKYTRDTRNDAVAARKALNRPRGRPLKLHSSTKVSRNLTNHSSMSLRLKKRSLKNIKSRRKMCELERLPTELLQKVFIYCMNINLPRSSPVISAKLSSESIYNQTILAAFGPTWNVWHRQNRSEQLSRPEDPESTPGDAELQSIILQCRWATLRILLSAQEVWVRRNARNRNFEPIDLFRSYGLENRRLEDQPHTKKTAAEYFEEDFITFSKFIQQQKIDWHWEYYSWNTYVAVEDEVEIPRKLLLGPWNEERTKYLFWIVRAGAHIEWLTSTSGEVALAGLKNAIVVGDRRVIHLLVRVGLLWNLNIDCLIWALRNAGGHKLAVIDQLLGLGFSGMSPQDTYKLEKALEEISYEAGLESDEEKFAFCQAVGDLQALRDINNREKFK